MVRYPVIFPFKKGKTSRTYICFGYQEDLEHLYSFYCARYENIKFDEFLKMGISEFRMKLKIPKSEPLYEIIKSRTINLSKIKDKEERKYWRNLKRINKIPDIYLSNEELDNILKEKLKNGNIGGLL